MLLQVFENLFLSRCKFFVIIVCINKACFLKSISLVFLVLLEQLHLLHLHFKWTQSGNEVVIFFITIFVIQQGLVINTRVLKVDEISFLHVFEFLKQVSLFNSIFVSTVNLAFKSAKIERAEGNSEYHHSGHEHTEPVDEVQPTIISDVLWGLQLQILHSDDVKSIAHKPYCHYIYSEHFVVVKELSCFLGVGGHLLGVSCCWSVSPRDIMNI
jgi:hypothetical protein